MLRTALAEARAQARLILDDSRSWGRADEVTTVIRGLLAEIDWLLLREAVLSLNSDTACSDELEYRLDQVRELHSVRVPHPEGHGDMCGVCAGSWPCRTLRAARGLAS